MLCREISFRRTRIDGMDSVTKHENKTTSLGTSPDGRR
jgi:hypothetical protein